MKRSNDKNFLVRKASGDEEPFSAEKLKSSLRNAGADEDIVEDVTMDILQWIYEGVTTRKIYSRAFSLLQQKKNHLAARYKLKKAILELGPTGYPFEHFVGKILEYKGYSTLVGQIVKGCCVSHEVDVIATSGNEQHLVECKYSQSAGKTVSVQVPLYVRSRVNDIIKKQQESEQYRGFTFYGWVVTNTRFTTDAIDYGNCCGLRLLSWDYPADKGLKDIIDREKIYPVTVLNQLSNIRKKILLEKDIVICRQLIEKPEVLEYLQLTTKEYRSLMNELEAIL
jgi:Holliday junction resolvase-like predicted endonuclease